MRRELTALRTVNITNKCNTIQLKHAVNTNVAASSRTYRLMAIVISRTNKHYRYALYFSIYEIRKILILREISRLELVNRLEIVSIV